MPITDSSAKLLPAPPVHTQLRRKAAYALTDAGGGEGGGDGLGGGSPAGARGGAAEATNATVPEHVFPL